MEKHKEKEEYVCLATYMGAVTYVKFLQSCKRFSKARKLPRESV
jgi:hypothetical protein